MRSNLSRKIIYGLIIVAILGAMIPYTDWLKGVKKNKDLGEAAIGQVDTGSFMLKLALLGGARGIAANVLWTRAEELKREHDWDRMKATIDLITKLQPHFLSVWTFQGWNLAYNVSVEWDAPEDKYDWIKKGIQFLEDGVKKNSRSPDLIWDTAWTYYHKLGFADESIILRRLFRDDDDEDFKKYIDYSDPQQPLIVGNDNFKLGFGWFSRAVALVDEGASRLQAGTRDVELVDPSPQRKGRPGDLAFRSMPAHAQTRYAAGLEKASILDIPATFGEVAKNEWAKALIEWEKFGTYTFMTPNQTKDKTGKLVDEPVQIDDIFQPKKYAEISENARYWTNRWADQMNYPYWKDRSMAEMTNEGVQARQLFYEGTIAYKKGDPELAAKKFREGLDVWELLLKEHPQYQSDKFNEKDTGLIVKRYVRSLKQLGEPEPEVFPFKALLQAAEQDTSVDPFDANEMLGPASDGSKESRTGGATAAPASAPSPK
ncbi:hypothetical protein SAMN05444166_2666 [Singulisphaera sp. GP187]|uniref:hypothetical protein n=1 Tax=Singulisphaera sp. GP187 TaxID=1882752 RepID=UPI00092C3F66|nr:hypothetical protein [Singulisphaera sp. GP187]SIO14062.1 hypothetical protein SAMN05444166_2666 [Singulisphaera sp. GP187]